MEFVTRSFVQAGVVVVVATLFWLGHLLLARLRGREREGWREWLGLTRPGSVGFGLRLFGIFLAVGAVAALVNNALVPGHEGIARESPAYKVANLPLGAMLLAAPAYAFVMTGFSEELLFRGVFGKRLVRWLGAGVGNVAQAALFGLMHVAVVYAAIAEPSLGLVLYVALFSGVIGWVLGWAMVRDGGSILAPWLAHSAANLATVVFYLVVEPGA